MDTEFFTVDIYRPRMLLVILRQSIEQSDNKSATPSKKGKEAKYVRPDAVIAEELLLVEHSFQDSSQSILTRKR